MSSPVSTLEWEGRAELCAVLCYLLLPQSVSCQNLKHPDTRLKKRWAVPGFHFHSPQGGLLIWRKLLCSRKLTSLKCFILCTQKQDVQNHLFIFKKILSSGYILPFEHQSSTITTSFYHLNIGHGLVVWCQTSLINALIYDASPKKYLFKGLKNQNWKKEAVFHFSIAAVVD